MTAINDDGRRWEYDPWRDGEFGPRNIARTFYEVSRQLNDALARAHLTVDDEPQPVSASQPAPVTSGNVLRSILRAFTRPRRESY